MVLQKNCPSCFFFPFLHSSDYCSYGLVSALGRFLFDYCFHLLIIIIFTMILTLLSSPSLSWAGTALPLYSSVPVTLVMPHSYDAYGSIFSIYPGSFVSLYLIIFQILDLSYTGLSDLPEAFVQLTSLRHKLQVLYLNGNQFLRVPQTLAALGEKQCLHLTS